MNGNNFAVAVATKDGKVLDYAAPLGFPRDTLIEAMKLGYEVYSIVDTIVRELGYKPPRNITVKTTEYEVTVFNRRDKLVFAVFTEPGIPVSTRSPAQLAET